MGILASTDLLNKVKMMSKLHNKMNHMMVANDSSEETRQTWTTAWGGQHRTRP